MGLICGLEIYPGGRHGNPLQYSCLEYLMDRGAWWDRVHRVAESYTTKMTLHAQIIYIIYIYIYIYIYNLYIYNFIYIYSIFHAR